jgi:hypothetical protein
LPASLLLGHCLVLYNHVLTVVYCWHCNHCCAVSYVVTRWAAASGSAEVFADVALCPFEMVKVRMQVTLPGGAEAALPKSMLPAMSALYANKAETKFPFGSLYPLWGRQGVLLSHDSASRCRRGL